MKLLVIFHILFTYQELRNFNTSCIMKPSTSKKPNCNTKDTVKCTEMASMDSYDPESLTNSFEQMKMSSPDPGSTCISHDDGYCSQSINSFDISSSTFNEDEDSAMLKRNTILGVDQTKTKCIECDNVSFESAFSQDSDGDTHLHIAIIQKAKMIAVWLISLVPGPDWLSIPNRLLQTPLHIAVIMRETGTVRRLMSSGARVDVRDVNGNTPLHIACKEGLKDIVSCLLKPVTYAETLDNKYQIPYQRIPQNLELYNYDGYNCLHLAAMGTYPDILDLLLSRGANINSRERKSGRTILHYAAETNNMSLMYFLLQRRGVDVNAETYGGQTPLRLAFGRLYTSAAELLIVKGAYDPGDDSPDEPMSDAF